MDKKQRTKRLIRNETCFTCANIPCTRSTAGTTNWSIMYDKKGEIKKTYYPPEDGLTCENYRAEQPK